MTLDDFWMKSMCECDSKRTAPVAVMWRLVHQAGQTDTPLRQNAYKYNTGNQGGITCGAIDDPRKSSKAIDERVIINFCDKNVVIARFRNKNVFFYPIYIYEK